MGAHICVAKKRQLDLFLNCFLQGTKKTVCLENRELAKGTTVL